MFVEKRKWRSNCNSSQLSRCVVPRWLRIIRDLVLLQVFHPNIDEEGKVCLNILRADWKPVLTMKAVIFGLELLFIEPNPDDPLNKSMFGPLYGNSKPTRRDCGICCCAFPVFSAAAKMLREDKRLFQQTVQRYVPGVKCLPRPHRDSACACFPAAVSPSTLSFSGACEDRHTSYTLKAEFVKGKAERGGALAVG